MGYGSAKRFADAQLTHTFMPLSVVFKNGVPVPVEDWGSALADALVQVSFTLHRSTHGAGWADMFSAVPSRIKLLKVRTCEKLHKKRKTVTERHGVDTGPIDSWVTRKVE